MAVVDVSEAFLSEEARIGRAQAALSACGVDGLVTGVERLRGQSHESWRVERRSEAPVVLRMEPERGILPPYDLRSEARLLRGLAESGIPVPRVLGVDVESAGFGRNCLVLEWVDGELLSKRQLDAEAAEAYCSMLRRIHTLDWQAAGLEWLPLPRDSGPALRERAEIAERLRSFGVEDAPHIRRLREALASRSPSQVSPMLVHGDVNFGNFMLGSTKRSLGQRLDDDVEETLCIAAVLDWEQSHLGDPLSDWGRLAAEDLLGNLDLSDAARQVMCESVERYQRSPEDLHYWTLHQLYKHSSATGALSVLRGWDFEQIAKMYAKPTERLLSGLSSAHSWV